MARNGIVVTVRTAYLADRSSPSESRFAFAYTVTIRNEGAEPAQLRSRHWIITDGNGEQQEVRGDGVVGEQPLIAPGQSFEYTSWCMLRTRSGSMRGSYQMVRPSGERFDAEIPAFWLGAERMLN
jgi:ApaG protein